MNASLNILLECRAALAQRADAKRAAAQQAYMKSHMSYWGVSMPETNKIGAKIFKHHVPRDNDEYRTTLRAFFEQAERREEWYLGMLYARKFKRFIIPANIDLYRDIVTITQWWDVVDEVAAKLIGGALLLVADRDIVLKRYIKDGNLWIRRTALLAQLKYEEKTNPELLSELILMVAHEKEFFIRKAIGWVLREYSYTNPVWVTNFIQKHNAVLSGLSVREGLKALKRAEDRASV